MVTSTDKEFIKAKLIKQGKDTIPKKFREFADWISNKYEVNVINICHEKMDNINNIRIGIAVESYADYLKFKENDERWSNFDAKIQNDIAKKYIELNKEILKIKSDKKLLGLFKQEEKPEAKDVFVATSAFEPIAREDANTQIPEKRIQNLIDKFKTPEIWMISRCFESATLFVFTDKQKATIKKSEIFKTIENNYFDILKEYDEFNYWKREKFKLEIDSKQNFDENYKSNWYYYYK